MLLDQTNKSKNIVAAKIISVFYPRVFVCTEKGDCWTLNLSKKEKSDSLFWEEMKRIYQASLWIPVGKKYHQLLDNGWLAPAQPFA
ncbi:hypothetical protein [Ligilactobacillus acidipiscis]|jgi:hypothetical protein|uniref:hypothetical protein n=1 Tax=Ligilactobacillus acidipiscis TaxID=89059 RepID=UPI0023F81F02|nr:hypothetical protein [Ligilactobacillus acidipiscis]WEV56629.1 hypothetical protein OZX66_10445 [Ligilactobacillus acidipiscis]